MEEMIWIEQPIMEEMRALEKLRSATVVVMYP